MAGTPNQPTQVTIGVVFACIAEALARGEDVSVLGFGRFSRKDRPARQGGNPRTGERVAMGASASVSVKVSEPLKDALN